MSQPTTRRWPRLAHLIFFAGYASAAFTLTNFEDISDKVSRKTCRTAYNTPLTHCKLEDFTEDNLCSSKCRASIKEVQAAIEEACEGISVDTNSLLYRGQKGQLVESLCKSEDGDEDTQTKATTTAKATTHTKKLQVETSVIQKKSTSTEEETSTTEAAQTTALVLAGDSDAGATESFTFLTSTTTSAQASETAQSNSQGGDPFATPENSGGSALKLGFSSFVLAAVVGVVVVM